LEPKLGYFGTWPINFILGFPGQELGLTFPFLPFRFFLRIPHFPNVVPRGVIYWGTFEIPLTGGKNFLGEIILIGLIILTQEQFPILG